LVCLRPSLCLQRKQQSNNSIALRFWYFPLNSKPTDTSEMTSLSNWIKRKDGSTVDPGPPIRTVVAIWFMLIKIKQTDRRSARGFYSDRQLILNCPVVSYYDHIHSLFAMDIVLCLNKCADTHEYLSDNIWHTQGRREGGWQGPWPPKFLKKNKNY
jgi:hypothetical protein